MQNSDRMKEEVYKKIYKYSEKFNIINISCCTAKSISEECSISRSLASHYLNELAKEEVLIKILSRPVFFLHKEAIERNYHITLKQNVFLNLDEFQQFIQATPEKGNVFMKMIGSEGSLKAVISQSTSAVMYPPNGLPIILTGEIGVGKRDIVSLLFDYGLMNHIYFSKSKFAEISLDKKDQEEVTERLKRYLFKEEHTGILCITHAQSLSKQQMEIIRLYLHRIKNKGKRSGFLLIMCMEENPYSRFPVEFTELFPVILKVPSLKEYSLEEKEELLIKYLKDESDKTGKRIYISSSAFRILCKYVYPMNRIELQRVAMLCCANAMDSKKDEILIKVQHFSEFLDIKQFLNCDFHELSNIISVAHYNADYETDRMIKFIEDLLNLFDDVFVASENYKSFFDKAYLLIKGYYEMVMLRYRYVDSKFKMIETLLSQIFEEIGSDFHISLQEQCCFVLARALYLFTQSGCSLKAYEDEHHQQIVSCIEQLNEKFPNGKFVSDKVTELINSRLDISYNTISQLLLLIYIDYFDYGNRQRRYFGIIISHGYATASSICDAVNTLLGEYIFDAIDMPLDTNMHDIVKKLQYQIQRFADKKVIVMVDMGSLEHLEDLIQWNTNSCEIGFINNVSTKLALHIGYGILKNREMKDLLESASKEVDYKYTIVKPTRKRKAILFISESGENTSKQMLKLFSDSLPIKIDVDFISYDYDELKKYGEEAPVFASYDILFIAGTVNPKVSTIPFIAVEDIISGSAKDQISKYLSSYMDLKNISELNKSLLVNFSLKNVMENITILNPKILIENVAGCVDKLEVKLNTVLDGRTKIGLYLHLSCLVERLVTKREKEIFELTLFKKEQKNFIENVNESFSEIRNHYQIELPVNEILYLYEYLIKDEKEVKRYRG